MKIGGILARLREYRGWVQLAEAQTGKGLLTQAREILALKQAGGRCGVTDYYWFRLYDGNYQRGRGAPDFLGWRLQDPLNLSLNPRQAVLPAWDKRVFHGLATASGLPVAPLKATFHPARRMPETFGRHLRSIEEAAAFLRQEESYPLFAKPAYSQQGIGALHLAGYDPAADSVVLADGSRLAVNDFVLRLVRSVDHRYHRPECGFLFQETLRLAPEIETLTGWPAICGVRVVCLNGPEGPRPIGAAWKIAVSPNTVDNFHMGSYGNLVAGIDLSSGQIGPAVDGLWPKARLLPVHPLTGATFAGFRLPGWDRLLQACRDAGPVFALMKIHHWDFALTDRGPVMIELNDMGGTQITQLHGRGLLTEETRAFLKQHADRRAHPWVNAL
ncbi:MAG: hypothetical protein KGZ43_02395 [Sulfuritalea sp.]|nr:hypothetical protein [Sulfuritalea sp.]